MSARRNAESSVDGEVTTWRTFGVHVYEYVHEDEDVHE